jgi:hypothetical protein
MSARLASASVTRDRALDTCEPAAYLGQLDPSLFMWSTTYLRSWGTWQHRSSSLGEARPGPHHSAGAHLGWEARSEAEEHMVALDLSSQGGRVWSHETHGSTGAHLGREARSGAEECVTALELNSARRRDPGPRATW